MPSCRLLFFLACWKRPAITEICFMGLNRLRKVQNFEVVAVISEESMKPLCKRYGIDYVYHPNDPLGEKKNTGLTYCMTKQFDYLVEIGSDDLLKNEFFEIYPFDGPVYGLRDFIMMNAEDGQCRRLSDRHAKFGVGRAIRRDVIERFQCSSDGVYRLWMDRINLGLDNNSMFAMAKKGILEKRFSCPDPVAIDVKSDVNLWPFKMEGLEYSFDQAVKGLSEEEITALKALHVPG